MHSVEAVAVFWYSVNFTLKIFYKMKKDRIVSVDVSAGGRKRVERDRTYVKKEVRYSDSWKHSGDVKAVPNQSMAIDEIVRRFVKGIAVDVNRKQPIYVDQTERDYERMSRMDAVDKAQAAKEFEAETKELSAKLKADEARRKENEKARKEQEVKKSQQQNSSTAPGPDNGPGKTGIVVP